MKEAPLDYIMARLSNLLNSSCTLKKIILSAYEKPWTKQISYLKSALIKCNIRKSSQNNRTRKQKNIIHSDSEQ